MHEGAALFSQSLSLSPLPPLHSSNDRGGAQAGLVAPAQGKRRADRWGRVTCVHTVEFSTTRFVVRAQRPPPPPLSRTSRCRDQRRTAISVTLFTADGGTLIDYVWSTRRLWCWVGDRRSAPRRNVSGNTAEPDASVGLTRCQQLAPSVSNFKPLL